MDSDQPYLLPPEQLTDQQAFDKYIVAHSSLKTFYEKVFNLDTYLPIVREGYEYQLNMIQYLITYAYKHPNVTPEDRVLFIMLGTQAAFWMGYLEGKSAEVIIPNAFKDIFSE